MQTSETRENAIAHSGNVNIKSLLWNGSPIIQRLTGSPDKLCSKYIEENTLLFVTEGVVRIKYGQLEYLVRKNEMAFLKKDIVIDYEAGMEAGPGQDQPDCMLITVKYELVKEFAKLTQLPAFTRKDLSQVVVNRTEGKLLKYLDTIKVHFDAPGKLEDSLMKIKLLELMFYLSSENTPIMEQILDVREHFRKNVIVTVEENIMNSLSLNQLAVLTGRSLSSFRRDFLAIYNMPPSKWIRKKRLEKAQELLANTSMTVTDICYTLGFENIAHFSRVFKLQVGYPPTEFRMSTLVA